MVAGLEEVELLLDDSVTLIELIGLGCHLWHEKWDAVAERVDFVFGYTFIQILYHFHRAEPSHLGVHVLPRFLNFLLVRRLDHFHLGDDPLDTLECLKTQKVGGLFGNRQGSCIPEKSLPLVVGRLEVEPFEVESVLSEQAPRDRNETFT